MSRANCITFVQQKAVQELHIPHHICQSDLSYILELRRQRDAVDEQISASEAAIRTALEAGAIVEPGIFQAYLKHTERRSVACNPDKYCSLVISA